MQSVQYQPEKLSFFIDKIDHGAFWFEDGTTHMQRVKSQTEM